MSASPIPIDLLPDTATDGSGGLAIGGVDVLDVTERFGTPVFIYDEQHLVDRCREAVTAFPDGVAYASKAFLCKAMARLAHDAGMSIDVATGGELYVVLAADVPPASIVFHGNNKSRAELEYALGSGVERIVIDSFDELDRVESLTHRSPTTPRILVRLNPGIEAHTHEYLQTGVVDSKFGFPVIDGLAVEAIDRVTRSSTIDFAGVHIHIGSQVFDTAPFERAMESIASLVIDTAAAELSIGGGLGVPYVEGETAPTMQAWADVVHSVSRSCGVTSRITAEPGRSIVASAAVTAYTVGTIKEIPGVREYVAVDGGMSDNPRPVLYGSGYEAFLPRSVAADRPRSVRIVGKHCESGDVIVRNAQLPSDLEVGDILCTPVTGAYGQSMGSNYNKVLRPAVVFVRDGEARVVVERETYGDLVSRDVG